MNIREAKKEIMNALHAYHMKDEYGNYVYPVRLQRPILLMGPPGIGKTAILEQIAKECNVGLVSYTITHHTRQSAVGLPEIIHKNYQDKEFSVTEYTMSEIVASVYECMERTGEKEGILFIDEINCVSETLIPTMLQFLQKKMFGSHKIPDGYLIVAAGNPVEYNRTAREFDIVTMDRVRCINIEADLDCWMQYAVNHGVHGSVTSYLRVKGNDFYYIRQSEEKDTFVTARGWEDLSQMITIYEKLGYEITLQQVSQFLREKEIAGSFAAYYQLYRKYQLDYGISQMLMDTLTDDTKEKIFKLANSAGIEERMTVAGLILDSILQHFQQYHQIDQCVGNLHEKLLYLKKYMVKYMETSQEEQNVIESVESFLKKQKDILKIKIDTETVSENRIGEEHYAIKKLESYYVHLKKEHIYQYEEILSCLKEMFQSEIQSRENVIRNCKICLEQGILSLEQLWGSGPEMTMLLSGILDHEYAMDYICRLGNDIFLKYTSILIGEDRRRKLQMECLDYLKESDKGEK